MSTFSLLLRSIVYYWRTNLAVLLGVMAGTAVIGGALVVGDSVRHSLRRMTLERLGGIDHALTGQRFFREELAGELADVPEFKQRFDAVAPALVVPGSLTSQSPPAASDGTPAAGEAGVVGASSPAAARLSRNSRAASQGSPAASGGTRRSNRVNVYGIDERLWAMVDHPDGVAAPQNDEAVLNGTVADELQVAEGDRLTLWIEPPSTIPRESLLGEREDEPVEIPLRVKAVLPEASGAGRLELNPNQQMPSVAFVSLKKVQQALGLHRRRERDDLQRRFIVKPARINTLFVGAKSEADAREAQAEDAAEQLTQILQDQWTLEDLRLRLVAAEQGYLSLESEQQILENAYAEAGRRAAEKLGLRQSPVMVYLANQFENASRNITDYESETGYSMYSVIAGVAFPDEQQPRWQGPFGPEEAAPPFGPFAFVGERPQAPLGETVSVPETPSLRDTPEVVLNEWLADDLKAQVGQEVLIRYHVVGSHGELPEEERRFRVHGIVKLEGPAADPHLTPRVEGITDADTFAEWDEPFPMEIEKITDRDELYWEGDEGEGIPAYRATPKAFVTLETAQTLWGSRYGQLTSLRVAPATNGASFSGRADGGAPPDGEALPLRGAAKRASDEYDRYEDALLAEIRPREIALLFQPVKYQGLEAASGTTDFAGLFVGFSFFLILAAMILIGLLFRLGIERRSTQVGLLSAAGFTPARIRGLFLLEGLLVVVTGGVLGTGAAVGYAGLMIYGLKNWWYGAIQTKSLFLDVTPTSLVLGFGISVIVASLAVWWALRQLRGLSARELLAGATEPSLSEQAQRTRSRRGLWTGIVNGTVAVVLVAAALMGAIPEGEAFSGLPWPAVAFFVVGIALLVASLAFLSAWLDSDRSAAVRGSGAAGMSRLGMRNASRHRQRSVLTTGLIASATFVIVAVAAGHRNPAQEEPQKDSGNGGFTLVAESATPILHDLNTPEGRRKLGLPTAMDPEADASGSPPPSSPAARSSRAAMKSRLLQHIRVVPFRVKPGDDASCLNIYKVRLPTILGVPQAMIERGGFRFVGEERENPWTLLNEELSDAEVELSEGSKKSVPVYPVLGDMTTLQWSLKKSKGSTIAVPNEENPDYLLKIAGVLNGSVFQRELLLSEESFKRLYPQQAGYRYFLIDTSEAERWLDEEIEQTRSRLEELRQRDGDDPALGARIEETKRQLEQLADYREDVGGWASGVLESELSDYGFDAEPVVMRLARFLAVQNTYLSTFQALGGLGLLLGTLGLATVMLRNVLERRSELALLRAVGFRNRSLGWLVLSENAFLLVWGLAAGTASALLAMTPHLTSTGAEVPWLFVERMLLGVFVVGMLAALLAVREAVRTPLLATLRSE